MTRYLGIIGCCAALFLLVSLPSRGQGPFSFRDVTAAAGIRFRHTDGSSGNRFIVESFSGGVALFDYDADGDLDIYFLNGAPLPGFPAGEIPRNALYRNEGHWQFTDVTEQCGLGDAGFGLGVCAADYDNDGFVDVYVSNFGTNALYRNNGDGSFSNVTTATGVAGGGQVGAGVCFFDMDNDGALDLYVANYLEFSLDQHRPHVHKGVPAYPSPLRYQPAADLLFRNRGDGTFADVSQQSGVGSLRGYGMGVVAADYDDDGDPDLFVANDVMANFLLQNDGTGKFTEVATLAGTAFDLGGKAQASMGVDAADFDNDGLVDFHVTSYSGEFATLYRNLGGGVFEDATRVTGAGEGTFPHVTWGNAFADFDNDGHRDLFIACGHLDDNIHLRGGAGPTAFAVRNVVLRNLGGGRFRDVSATAGTGLSVAYSSRGLAIGDLDRDGKLDVVVLNSREPPTLLHNASEPDNGWLTLRLIGRQSNRSSTGATVKVHSGSAVYTDTVRSGRGYQGHFGDWLHFGLTGERRVEKIVIRWPSGRISELQDLSPNRRIIVVEGSNEAPFTR